MDIRMLALLAITAAATGCGNGGNAPSAETAMDESETEQEAWDTDARAGCELVSDEEIRAALGEAVVEKEEGGWYGCRWKTQSFTVGLSAFADTSLPADSCAAGGKSMPYGKSAMGRQELVEGLGDAAIWGSSGDLLVCTGRGLLTVDMEQTPSTMSPSEEKDVAIPIARSALKRLEGGSR